MPLPNTYGIMYQHYAQRCHSAQHCQVGLVFVPCLALLAKVALAAEIYHCKTAEAGPRETRQCQGRGQFPKFVDRPVLPDACHDILLPCDAPS